MRQFINRLFPAPFEFTLVISFTFVAAITIGVSAWVISHTIDDYLTSAMNDRIARDMRLAQTFYNDRLFWYSDIANRLALDTNIVNNLQNYHERKTIERQALIQELTIQAYSLLTMGTHAAFVQSPDGHIIGGVLFINGETTPIQISISDKVDIPIVTEVLEKRTSLSSTEVIPIDQLQLLGLGSQAFVPVLPTEKAAPKLFDVREGKAGLVLISISPVIVNGETIGAVTVFHLLNNDYTLVDHIKNVAGIDTVTIFFGDQRISTNVVTNDGRRAVGTRLSQDVGDVVLYRGENYIGPAFVVNQNYITRYDPLRDHQNNIVGILYVGASQNRFLRLLLAFNQHVMVVAILSILVTFLLSLPVARMITRPLKELKVVAEVSERVGKGDFSARVPYIPRGEVGLVAKSFNSMLDKLQAIQEKLIQTEKLASLGHLAAGVAHELNNPLATILLYTDILQRDLQAQEQSKEDLKTIMYETLRCKNIVGALLNFARQTQVNAQPTDLNHLIQDIVSVEKNHPRYSNIQIELELDRQLPMIQVDPAQIREVIINLTNNAVDAMPDGGIIRIRTLKPSQEFVAFEVEDTGKGIPPENMSKLFTPFFTTKPIGKGTGLGLAIIYGIVKMHRGQIDVQSELGKGTKFTILLPLKLPEKEKFNNHEDLIG
ncbi:MAG: cache domain-containing protein [Anaerolineales bacterium]